MRRRFCCALVLTSLLAFGQSGREVAVIVNTASPDSAAIAEYYLRKRSVPSSNVFRLRLPLEETINRRVYEREIAAPVAALLKSRQLTERVLYLVTTLGVPLRIDGSGGQLGDQASVDSELTLLYRKLRGDAPEAHGAAANPYYAKRGPFRHPEYPMYLVTRLAAYDVAQTKAAIDRCDRPRNRGKVVLDLNSPSHEDGNSWLRTAAMLLPEGRVLLEETKAVVYGARDVIGYASWGSNDPNRDRRRLGFTWLPGALATEYVSSNGRTFVSPPEDWSFRVPFAGTRQSLAADLIAEGATGASGHVYEPYLQFCPRPNLLFASYLEGRNLAESFYSAIPALSWRNIVIGDPLCRLQ